MEQLQELLSNFARFKSAVQMACTVTCFPSRVAKDAGRPRREANKMLASFSAAHSACEQLFPEKPQAAQKAW